MQTLFWAAFGLIEMKQFNLAGIDEFTKFAAKTILGTYAVITIVVLLNLLIAMLNNSYQLTSVSTWISVIDLPWQYILHTIISMYKQYFILSYSQSKK